MKPQFDLPAFFAALDAERIGRRLQWKEVAAQSGVSASTLTRISQGRRPDVDSLAALIEWSGMRADTFLRKEVKGFGKNAAPLAQISSLLRRDANLSKESAVALEEMIKAAYQRLRKH
jgi:transcriptional regulator with XRE-family HTH domain